MTAAQRLAQALYGYHDEKAVEAARDYVARLDKAGYAVVPDTATWAQLAAGQKAWLADPERRSSTLYAAMIRAFQQEISAE